LQKYYANKYYQEANGSYELEYTQDELNYFKAKLEQRMAVLKKCLPASNGEIKRMLDVGCGEGYALAFFREQGWIVKGIDFSSAGVDSKNPACGDVLETGDVFDLLNAEIAVGKASHKARVQIENLIHEQPIEDVLRFWSAIAKLGIGRDITAFLRPMSAN